MTWFRLYHEFITDQKVIELPEKLQLFLVKIWCVSSRQIERGTLPKIEVISKMIGVTKGKTSSMIRDLIDAGFIDEDVDTKALAIHAWRDRQYDSDDAAERKRDQRRRDMSRDKAVTVTVHQSTEYRETEKRGESPTPYLGSTANTSELEPFETEPPASVPLVNPEPYRPPTPEVLAVIQLADTLFPMMEFGRKADAASKHHKPEVIEEALRRNHKRGKAVNWSYVQGTINGLESEGWTPRRDAAGKAMPSGPKPYHHPPMYDRSKDPLFIRAQEMGISL